MASKSAKRARVDASSSKDSSAANSTPLMAAGGADRRNEAAVDEDVVSRLRSELETATKCIEQLRREKDYEVRQVREEEQNRSSSAIKDLENRLKADCRREVERAREVVKSRMEADTARLANRYERTVKRLSNDLDRCRNELREEVEKRGMSSTTRGCFETERCRLLTEVRDLKAAKRRLEESVESYSEVDKQRTAELKRVQEACKAEVAKVSKEANAEIRKLLEELKAKDHQLALLDRNQYPDRGASLPKQHLPNESQPKETDSTAALRPVKPATTGEASDSKANRIDDEIISSLKKEVEKLRNQLAVSEADRTAMKVRLDDQSRQLAQRNETIANLEKVDRGTQNTKPAVKNPPKAVRFLLPGSSSPVLAREVEPAVNDDDDRESITSDMSESSMSSSSSVLSQDTTVLYDQESIVKNYKILLSEHLNLQRSISLLLSSWTSASSVKSSSALSLVSTKCSSTVSSIDEITSTCNRQDCMVEKESMKVAMEALEKKHAQYEQNVYQLQQQLKEEREVNEDLEFRVFELEDCAEKCKLAHSNNAAEELFEKTRFLEEEMSALKERLTHYKMIESEVVQPAGLGLREYVEIVRRQLCDAEKQSAMSHLEVIALRKQLEEVAKCQVEVSIDRSRTHVGVTRLDVDEVVANSRDAMIDVDDLSISAMNSSMSTTSGFDDDDNSCTSSVADLRLDEMPSEEAWGIGDDACVSVEAEPAAEQCVAEKIVARSNGCGDRNVKERKYSAKLDLAQSQQCHNRGDGVSAEAVRVSDEEMWLSRFEKLEARLAQAMQNEQRARDQAALLGEEKDRRIAALQEQVDQLEANEFRLSETIRSLERLERKINQHMKNSEDRSSCVSSSRSTSSSSAPDTVTVIAGVDDRRAECEVCCPTDIEDACFHEDLVDKTAELAMNELCAAATFEDRMQHETSAMLTASLEQLRLTEAESDAVDKRIKDLSNAIDGMNSDETAIVVSGGSSSGSSWAVPAEIVDFEAEYRELEILIRELKRVLIVEDDSGKRRLSIDVGGENVGGKNCTSDEVESTLAVETSSNWETGSACYSIPASPMFEIQSPNGLMMERSRQFEQIECCLTQQIRNLEHERDTLRDAVCEGEATMRELGIQLVELRSSERSLKDEVGRLKAKEEWMISRNDELMELVGRLEDSVKSHRASEIEMRSRAERHCASETELGRELDDARDELRAVETRYRRWVAQLDDEKVNLQTVVDELMEKNSDLEGREAGLLCRIRKLEAAEYGLRSEVADLERTLIAATEDRERLLTQVSNKEREDTVLIAVPTVDSWTQCDNGDGLIDYEEQCRQLADRADFFKEMLEFTELSYAGLESRFAERVAAERALLENVAEHETVQKALLERAASLEAETTNKAKKITELEATIEDMKRAASAFHGIMLLSEVADEIDDSETILWAAVENARIGGDGVTETELTSSVWSDVEARMGLNSNSPALSEDNQQTDPALTSSNQQPTSQPPPLPLSPPPSSPTADVENGNFLFDRQRANGESVETVRRLTHQQRSHSADPFSQKTPATSDEDRWKRANSESRNVEAMPLVKEQSKTNHAMEHLSYRPTDSAPAAVRDPIMERITRSREFWSARSISMPGQQHPTPGSSARHHHSSSNGRPSLIPRIALPVRTPPIQRSISEYGGPKAGWLPNASTAMPVIRSTPSPHLSPKSSSSELDDKKNTKSYIPRPINECRLSGSDSESSEQHATNSKQTITSQTVTHGRPGHRESSKIYTTVMGPNRYATSKFSHLSSSSQNPQTARTFAVDSKANPASAPTSSAMAATQLTQRPAVTSTASGSEVLQLPSSRA